MASFRKIDSSSQTDSEIRLTDGNFASLSDWAAAGVDVLGNPELGDLRSGAAAWSKTLAEREPEDLRSGVSAGSETWLFYTSRD